MKFQALNIMLIASVAISGCMSKPIKEGSSDISKKVVEFPQLGKTNYVVPGGMVMLSTNYSSGYRYKLKSDLQQSVQMGLSSIRVSSSDELVPSTVQDEVYHCTRKKSMYQLLGGLSTADVCFHVKNNKISHLKYGSSILWMRHEFEKPLDVDVDEVTYPSNDNIMKKELIYEGYSGDEVLFSFKAYDKDLEKPSSIKPYSVKINKIPEKIKVLEAEISIDDAKPNSLTYSVVKHFEFNNSKK